MTHVTLTIRNGKWEQEFQGDYPDRKTATRAVAPTIEACAKMLIGCTVDFRDDA